MSLGGDRDRAGPLDEERALLDLQAFKIPSVPTPLPTASAYYRRRLVVVQGGVGVADECFLCLKSALDAYSWVSVAIG